MSIPAILSHLREQPRAALGGHRFSHLEDRRMVDRDRLGAVARESMEACFTRERVLAELLRWYQQLLGG